MSTTTQDPEIGRLEEAARRIRVGDHSRRQPGQGRAPGRAALRGGHAGRAVLPRHAHPARRTRLAGSRPVHSLQGPLVDRAVRRAGPARLLPRRGARRPSTPRAPRLQGHPDMTRLPGLDMSTGSLGMGISAGHRDRPRSAPDRSERRSDVRHARRRRVPGRRGLGGGDGRGPLRPRHPHRDRRPQQAPAVRLARGRTGRPPATGGAGRARGEVGCLRLAGPGGRRPRHARRR